MHWRRRAPGRGVGGAPKIVRRRRSRGWSPCRTKSVSAAEGCPGAAGPAGGSRCSCPCRPALVRKQELSRAGAGRRGVGAVYPWRSLLALFCSPRQRTLMSSCGGSGSSFRDIVPPLGTDSQERQELSSILEREFLAHENGSNTRTENVGHISAFKTVIKM